MKAPKVTVAVPVYNSGSFLERCCISLFSQSYENMEILFCDDASSDNGLEIIKATASKFPTRNKQVYFIQHQYNQGVAASRDDLVRMCTGEYLVFVDSDDWLSNDAIEHLVQKQIETHADIVTGQMVYVEDNRNRTITPPIYKNKDEMMRHLVSQSGFHSLSARLYRSDIIKNHHVSAVSGKNMGEDWLFLVKTVYWSTRIENIQEPVYYYDRTNQKSAMHLIWNQSSLLNWRKEEMDNLMEISLFLNSVHYQEINLFYEFLLSRINDALVESASLMQKKYFKYFRSIYALIPKHIVHNSPYAINRYLYYYGTWYYTFVLYIYLGGVKNRFLRQLNKITKLK